jgi:hypothetical protein
VSKRREKRREGARGAERANRTTSSVYAEPESNTQSTSQNSRSIVNIFLSPTHTPAALKIIQLLCLSQMRLLTTFSYELIFFCPKSVWKKLNILQISTIYISSILRQNLYICGTDLKDKNLDIDHLKYYRLVLINVYKTFPL